MLSTQVQKYQQNAVMTASSAELTLMLYNGAIKFCNIGLETIEKKDVQTTHKYIVKAQDIIQELYATLDDTYPISAELKPLYEYIGYLLIETNIKKSSEKLLEAKQLIEQFRDLWKEVMKQPH